MDRELNGLFLQWLHEMHEEERKTSLIRPSHMRNYSVYKKAYDELKKFPHPLRTPQDSIKLERRYLDMDAAQIEALAPIVSVVMDIDLAPAPKARKPGAKKVLEEPTVITNSTTSKASAAASIPGSFKTNSTAPKTTIGASKSTNSKTVAPRSERQYIPRYRSAAWAILVTLRISSRSVGYMSKSEIIKIAQDHCDTSFNTVASSSSMYNGWSAMATLIEKDLVARYGNPARFCLTEDGKALANKMEESMKIMKGRNQEMMEGNNEDSFVVLEDSGVGQANNFKFWYLAGDNSRVKFKSEAATRFIGGRKTLMVEIDGDDLDGIRKSVTEPIHTPSGNVHRLFKTAEAKYPVVSPTPKAVQEIIQNPIRYEKGEVVLPAGSFEVVCLLDNREVKSGSSGVDRSFFQDSFRERGVLFETRKLELGDFLWVARSKFRHDVEIVLDCILERKTLDDLVASIKDGRFKEQKDCGLQCRYFGMEAVHTAFTQTQVEDGFFLKRTQTAEESMLYLASISKQLSNIFARTTIRASTIESSTKPACTGLITFADFTRLNLKTKNFVLKDVWTRQLMTVSGISAEKASIFEALRSSLIKSTGEMDRKAFGPTLCKRLLNIFWHS
ncbi:hypothetical protein BC829DRAFT_392594 [Chytridium lagenaria]|nr:hypothetical protein BC829DRAFT_392594 [Chytridium lagenaria]